MTRRISTEARAELETIVTRDGVLTPASVLQAATAKDNPLHSLFTWDNKRAAHLRRLDEAREVIVAVRVVIEPRAPQPPIAVRAYVSLAEDRVAGGGYRPIQTVLGDPNQRAALLRTALAELGALQRRYATLSELAQVFAALDEVMADAAE